MSAFRAAHSGRFDWYPDWRDRCVAIIASGPSVTKAEVALLKGRLPVMAIKENVDVAPFADVVYGCDAAWWQNRNGLKEFKGLKVSAAPNFGTRFPDIKKVTVPKLADEMMLGEPGIIGAGGNSGFQAVNLAVQFGATRILLVGFDMVGEHWYGRNTGIGRTNPNEDNFRRWRAAFAASAAALQTAGVDVVNASPVSSLRCFRRATVAATLDAWGV